MIKMITTDIFLLGLMIVSTLTGFVTEAIKKILAERKGEYRPNTISGIVAAILSAGLGTGYMIVKDIAFSGQMLVYIIALVFMGWLGAMIGYDKITALLTKTNKKG
jgi:hypothetical protein